MKLTRFGEAVRIIRLKKGVSLKAMADAMGISSAYLSSMEFGDKPLADKHIENALRFLAPIVTSNELTEVRSAAEQSKTFINTEELSGDARELVATFARKLKESRTDDFSRIKQWLDSNNSEG